MTIRVLLVDDHAVVRQGLRMFLSLDAELAIVGEAVNGADALQKAHDLQPDVCLLYTSPSPRDRTRSRMPSSA